MAWTEAEGAVLLREVWRYEPFRDVWLSPFSGWFGVTSTSTVRIGTLGSRLYMYGVQGGATEKLAEEAGGDLRVWKRENQARPTSCPEALDPTYTYIGYLVSGPRTEDYAFDITLPAYGADASAIATFSAEPISTTCVRERKSEFWKMPKVLGYSSTPPKTTLLDRAWWELLYKDPCVLELPGGQGWVMLLVRAARRYELDGTLDEDKLGDVGHSHFALVAYWSPTPTFSGPNVVGPHLVVSDLAALPAELDRGDPNFRVSLGVPSAAILTTDGEPWLYLYYTTARNTEVNPKTELETDPYLDEPMGYVAAAQDYGDAYNYRGTLRTPIEPDFRQGIACKRFRLAKLVASLQEIPAEEATWEPSDALDGELLGLIRFWFAAGEVNEWTGFTPARRPAAQPFHVPWTGSGSRFGDFGKLVDPAPIACGGNLTLFIATIERKLAEGEALAEHHGQGIWRGTSTADIGRFYDREGEVWRDLQLGLDFIVREEDRVLVSTATHAYIDPDACLIGGGSVRLFVHDSPALVLVYIDGTHEDLCADLDDYWDDLEPNVVDLPGDIDIDLPDFEPPDYSVVLNAADLWPRHVHEAWYEVMWSPFAPVPEHEPIDGAHYLTRARPSREWADRIRGVELHPMWHAGQVRNGRGGNAAS